MWETLAIVALVALAAALVAVIAVAKSKHILAADRDRLGDTLAQTEQQRDGYRDEIRNLEQQIAAVQQQLAVAEQTHKNVREQFDQAQKQLREAFASLSTEALKQSSEQFLQLAKKTFESEKKDAAAQLENRKQAIEALLEPIRETLGKHHKAVGELETKREGAYQSLRQQLLGMVQDQKSLRDETANLVKALRRPEVRGAWGHLQLERVAELAGMMPHVVYDREVTADDGTLRADMVVHLPGAREIVIDAKTPIDAYISAMEAGDDADREQLMQRHISQIESKVRDLSSKRYQDHFKSADFVVMFIPGEAFLQPAVVRKPALMEEAMEKGVIIATPTMLVALLKVVALGWREEKIAENAERICALGQELHERIAIATNHVDKLGSTLEAAVKTYNDFVGSFESRVVVSARKFKELGADSPKELPAEGEIMQVEVTTREIKTLFP